VSNNIINIERNIQDVFKNNMSAAAKFLQEEKEFHIIKSYYSFERHS
jgi:hypothetical protein